MNNKFDILGIKESIKNIENATNQASQSLDIIKNEIKDSIGISGTIWSGEAAINFRNNFDEIEANMKEYKEIINTQIINLKKVLNIEES